MINIREKVLMFVDFAITDKGSRLKYKKFVQLLFILKFSKQGLKNK